MSRQANRKRLWLGYWILAALLLSSYSGYKMMTLMTPAIPLLSQEMKGTRENLHKIQKLTSLSMKNIEDNLNLNRVFQVFAQKSQEKAKADTIQKKEKEPDPPEISGIFQTITSQGEVEYQAVIKGKCLRENDSVNGFTVKEITLEGVTLSKKERKWSIPSPNVSFSLDRGL